MKNIIVSGATASGKDTILDAIETRLKEELGPEGDKRVARGRYCTTRKAMRPGEVRDRYFLSDEEFNEKVRNGEMVFHDRTVDYQVGYLADEFEKAEIVLVNIALQFVKPLKERLKQRGGEGLSIFVTAPRPVRVERIRRREGWLIYEPAEHKVENDFTPERPEGYEQDIDLVIENKEGSLEGTLGDIYPRVKEFINK